MNVKRYTADSIVEAMEQVRQELGRDAFILQQRAVRPKGLKGFFQKPLYEVVAAYEPKETPPRAANPLPSLLPGAGRPAPGPHTPPPQPPSLDAPSRRPARPEEPAGSLPGNYAPPPGRRPVFRPSAEEPEILPPEPLGPQPVSPAERVVGRGATPESSGAKLAFLENKIDALSSSIESLVARMPRSHDGRALQPDVDAQVLPLLENEVHDEFAAKIGREVSDIVSRQKGDASDVMEQILRQYVGSAEPVRLKRYKRTVVMLVGPTGVGKTTTLAKLAAIYAINHHARVGVITTDTYRIAAVEQLKTYTQILEVPLSIVYAPEEIREALKEHEDCDVVFIDTAGKSPSDKSHEEEISALIRHSDCDEVHLVLSATTSFTGLLGILNAYSFLTDYRIIFTKLDETPTWGAVLNARFLADRPLSYLTMGQAVPDDIEVADTRKIVSRLMTRDP